MADTFSKGNMIGGFEVIAEISTGEFGETWLCENHITKRKAVLKGLKEDIQDKFGTLIENFDIVTRTKEEARIVAALGDRRFRFVPSLFDAIELPDGRVFFLTEFVDGKMLCDWSMNSKKQTLDRARVCVRLLSAVAQLHDVGIVHRDLAGDNIIIDDGDNPFLVDFGLASIKSAVLVKKYSGRTVDPFTKAKYTPPKVFEARVKSQDVQTDESWDLYALGVLISELFLGDQVAMPRDDLTDDVINAGPCPNSVQMLLENGYSDDAPGSNEISVVLNGELRNAGLANAFLDDVPGTQIVKSLNEEIVQLRRDLASKRGKTDLADISDYLQRLGFVYTVVPQKKYISLRYSADNLGDTKFILDGSSDQVLEIHTIGFRTIKTKKRELLEALNNANWNSSFVKILFDPDDGEVRLMLSIPHACGAIPYEEFSQQLVSLLKLADIFAGALDERFSSPERTALAKAKSGGHLLDQS
ncbi:MAG: hypothetical protein CMJ58_14795 [Planctomycetaceae bacterium]|nr:hypothetical protein [Planctomycetaceae bacterium]